MGRAKCYNTTIVFFHFHRNTALRLVIKLQRSAAAAGKILVKMEEHAQKYVSPQAFGTIALVQQSL